MCECQEIYLKQFKKGYGKNPEAITAGFTEVNMVFILDQTIELPARKLTFEVTPVYCPFCGEENKNGI